MMRVNCREEEASSDASLDGKQDTILELKTLLIERCGGFGGIERVRSVRREDFLAISHEYRSWPVSFDLLVLDTIFR